MKEYGINWDNVDLSQGCNRDQDILDNYSFNNLLLELHCNIPTQDLTKLAILRHAKKVLQCKMNEALEILENNAENILNHELQQRKD